MNRYFASGWAFFIPYLALYLIYGAVGGPANPVGGGTRGLGLPPLTTLFRGLHVLHVLLAAVALLRWYRFDAASGPLATRVGAVLPWASLGIVYLVPGLYLEWPADAWEHLRRINEWGSLDAVTGHSTWTKFSYYFAYSLVGAWDVPAQLAWLNFYYAAACLALSWQYFRFARALGLAAGAALVFVFATALTLGNNVFAFHRYYGLSSSVLAQLAAVAVIRAIIEFSLAAPSRRDWPGLVATLAAGLALVGFNHPQAIGIVLLGGTGVAAWKLWTQASRRAILLTVVLLALTAAIMPVAITSPTLDQLRAAGWLSAWNGLAVFTPSSPAFDRVAQILGWFGAVNLLAGLYLLTRGHLVGFLTVVPIVILALPQFAVPLSLVLEDHLAGERGVFLFHRLLLAIPASLAVVSAGQLLLRPTAGAPWRVSWVPAVAGGIVALAGFGGYSGTRVWHVLARLPDDLSLRSHVVDLAPLARGLPPGDQAMHATKIGADLLEIVAPSSKRALARVHFPPLTKEFLRSMAEAAPAPDLRPAFDSRDITVGVVPTGMRPQSRRIELAQPESWTDHLGQPNDFTPSASGLVIANRPGRASAPFSASPVMIDRSTRYQVSVEVRATGALSRHNYLAIAWYDVDNRLLVSRELRPAEPGYPSGWINGDFSYFGLAAAAPGSEWTRYTIEFGRGERAMIPTEARSFRVGALLNQDLRENAVTQVRGFAVVVKEPPRQELLVAPDPRRLHSPISTAGFLSRHWSPQHAAADHAGFAELATVARGRPR